MGLYVLMTRLTPEISGDLKRREAIGKEWKKKVSKLCPDVKWKSHYWLLGPYDFMDIYDAPSIEDAHKVSLISRAEGAVSAESWQALPYEQFIHLLEEIEV